MTVTWIDESWHASTSAAVRAQHARYWATIFGLGLADGLSFFLTHYLFRYGNAVPSFVLFTGVDRRSHSTPIDLFAMLGLVFIFVRYLSGDYNRRQLFWDGAKVTTMALIVASIIDFLMLLAGQGLYSAMPLVLSWSFLLVCVPLMRQAARAIMTRLGVWQIPTAIIGCNPSTIKVHDALKHSLALGFDVRWLVVENPETQVPNSLETLRVLHSSDATSIAGTIWAAGCKEAIITAEDVQSPVFTEVAQRLLEVNIPVAIVPSFTRLPLAGVTTNYFFGRDILLLHARSNLQRLPWRFVKRTFDLFVSAVLLILLAPLFLFIAIAIKIDTKGPATYWQKRVGRAGVQFKCLKFRTMATDADELLNRWKTENTDLYRQFLVAFKLRDDPRVTRAGKWLRRTSLDEIPQLWNVLRGDMSLVGPRPIPEQQLRDQYGNAAHLYVRVRPGISGLWQISGRSETTGDQRVILDEWYILNWSFWYDIVILIQTAWIVMTGKGAF